VFTYALFCEALLKVAEALNPDATPREAFLIATRIVEKYYEGA
jgi:hypothetical protein